VVKKVRAKKWVEEEGREGEERVKELEWGKTESFRLRKIKKGVKRMYEWKNNGGRRRVRVGGRGGGWEGNYARLGGEGE